MPATVTPICASEPNRPGALPAVSRVRCPDLTPEQWTAIWPIVVEAWTVRMTSAGVAAVLEASPPWPA